MSRLDRLSFRDGTTGYAYSGESVTESMAGSWDMANADVASDIEWSCDDLDDDGLDYNSIMIDAVTLAELMRLAAIGARYAGCTGCERVTEAG